MYRLAFLILLLVRVAGLQANDQVIMPADSAWGMQPSDGTVYAQPVRTSSEEQGEVVILLLLLPVFSLFVFAFRPYLSTNLLVSGRMQLADQIMREREFSSGLPGLVLHVLFAVSVGVLLWHLFPEAVASLLPSGHTWQLLILFTVWPLLYWFRFLVSQVFGLIFRMRSAIGRFRFRADILIETTGFFLFPVVCLLMLSPSAMQEIWLAASAIILSILVIWRWYALLRVAGSLAGFRVSYFLLYFCAFEIAPVLVVFALVSGRSGLDF